MANYTKQVLESTLIKLMKTYKLNDISVKQLVAECGMNRKTFYYHYGSIADMLMDMLERELRAAVAHRTLPSNWKKGGAAALECLRKNRGMMQNIYSSVYWPEIKLGLNRLLNECVDSNLGEAYNIFLDQHEGKARLPAGSYNYILRFYSGAIMALVEQWFVDGMKETGEEYVELFDNFLHDGMFFVFDRFARPMHGQFMT